MLDRELVRRRRDARPHSAPRAADLLEDQTLVAKRQTSAELEVALVTDP